MSLSANALQLHCQTIIGSPRAQNKVVILCEGNIQAVQGCASPSSYRQLEKLPDANFYKACVPNWWQQKRPEFFVCGDRVDVVNTYFKLLNSDCEGSRFDKTKLFAIIDLDLPLCEFADGHCVTNSETLFHTLYQQGKINRQALAEQTIFITGLMYKEGYFLIPDLQTVFDTYATPVHYKNNLVNLEAIYRDMLDSLHEDRNIQQPTHFPRACERIAHCVDLDFTNITTLQASWLQAFDVATGSSQHELILALLSIHQVKRYWQALTPPTNSGIPQERFEEQLTLAIAKFYAKQERDSNHHIPSFFTALSGRA
ncbi:MAG: hypothetical protein NTV43_10950 [Methylococcales bacterium]|nr:hypothetical protein [Methylococcales bacterium]